MTNRTRMLTLYVYAAEKDTAAAESIIATTMKEIDASFALANINALCDADRDWEDNTNEMEE